MRFSPGVSLFVIIRLKSCDWSLFARMLFWITSHFSQNATGLSTQFLAGIFAACAVINWRSHPVAKSLSLSLACDPALSFSALFVRLSFSFISRRQIPKTLKRPVLVNLHKSRTNLRRLAKFSRCSKLIWRQSWNKTANSLKENPN